MYNPITLVLEGKILNRSCQKYRLESLFFYLKFLYIDLLVLIQTVKVI